MDKSYEDLRNSGYFENIHHPDLQIEKYKSLNNFQESLLEYLNDYYDNLSTFYSNIDVKLYFTNLQIRLKYKCQDMIFNFVKTLLE